MVKKWYAEEVNYDYKTGEAKKQGAEIYHFTQMVWKATKKLGYGNCCRWWKDGSSSLILARGKLVWRVQGKCPSAKKSVS